MLNLLPECDRSFTRSDALAKHMRTVHEIEALRPSDPIPKSMTQLPSGKSVSKLKLIMKVPSNKEETPQPQLQLGTNGNVNDHDLSAKSALSDLQDLGITAEEQALGPRNMFRLFRRQVHWAEQESEELKKEIALLEDIRRQEFVEKEILMDAVIRMDLDHTVRRRAVLAGAAGISSAALKAAADNEINRTVSPPPGENTATGNSAPAQREMGDDERAAAVLASLHQV